MLKIKSFICIEVNGRQYEFSCPPDSPLPDVLDANNQINAFILGRAEQAKIAQKPEEPKEEPKVSKEEIKE